MEFLAQLLPIIIYILLIGFIIVGIILGIKLIITIDKVLKIVDNVNEKIEKVTPIFDVMGVVSGKLNTVVSGVVGGIENLVLRLFTRNNKNERKSDEDE